MLNEGLSVDTLDYTFKQEICSIVFIPSSSTHFLFRMFIFGLEVLKQRIQGPHLGNTSILSLRYCMKKLLAASLHKQISTLLLTRTDWTLAICFFIDVPKCRHLHLQSLQLGILLTLSSFLPMWNRKKVCLKHFVVTFLYSLRIFRP
jgi:hypothetical protein